MVDNRSAGVFGVGGAFNFKSGDISGTAANTQDDKMDSNEYFGQGQQEEEQNQTAPFVDRSAQLRATLNSLAMMNVASVLNERKRIEVLSDETKSKNKRKEKNEDREDLDEEFVNDLQDDSTEDEEDNEYY